MLEATHLNIWSCEDGSCYHFLDCFNVVFGCFYCLRIGIFDVLHVLLSATLKMNVYGVKALKLMLHDHYGTHVVFAEECGQYDVLKWRHLSHYNYCSPPT